MGKREKVRRGIFISYRRADSAGEAGRLADHLGAGFGEDTVFFDVAGIAAGDDWRQRLDTALDACDTMLVVIGRQWLALPSATYPRIRRIDEQGDMVAWEVARGLARGLRVVQLLVQGSAPLVAESLPPPLAGLAMRQSVALRHESFASDVRALATQIRRARRVRSVFSADWRAADLSPWCRVLDTGNDCTCAAMTIVNALELLLARAGAPTRLSVRYLYEKARRSQESRGDEGGLHLLPAMFVAGFFGVPHETVWPYKPEHPQLPHGLDWGTLEANLGTCCRGDFFRVDGLSDAVRQLAAGRPIIASVCIKGDDWFKPPCSQTGEVPMPPVEYSWIGGATVLLTGFDPANRVFRFMATWGKGWGDLGFGRLSLDVAQRVLEPGKLWSVELAADSVGQLLEERATASQPEAARKTGVARKRKKASER